MGNKTLASYHLWGLLIKAGKECDQLEKAVKDKEFLHSLNQESLEAITKFPFFWKCLKENEKLKELFKDQTLIDRLSSYHIGDLLEHSSISKQVYIFRNLRAQFETLSYVYEQNFYLYVLGSSSIYTMYRNGNFGLVFGRG